MYPSVRRNNFQDLGITDIGVARAKIREISDIAHARGMKVAVYLDPIGLYNPIHDFGCDLIPHLDVYNIGWSERNEMGEIKRLSFSETLSKNYAVTASPYGSSKTSYADENSGFSPTVIDNDLASGENWSDPSYHYHIAKQFRWLVKNYDFDIFFVDDTGRLIMTSLGSVIGQLPIKFGSNETCKTGLTRLSYPHDTPYGIYNSPEAETLKQQLGSSGSGEFTRDDYFTLDSYANMLRHIRWQLKDVGDDKALFSSDYFVPWPSMVASEDASSTDQFTSDMGDDEKGCHILWSEQTYDIGFKPLRPAHYEDPVNIPPISSNIPDPRVIAGWTWSNRGINLFDYPKFSPYETNPDSVVSDLKNYLTMYNSHPEIFSDPSLNLDSVGRNSMWFWDLTGNNKRYKGYPSIYPSQSFNLETQMIQRYRESTSPLHTSSTNEVVRDTMMSNIATAAGTTTENKTLIDLVKEYEYSEYPEVVNDSNIKIDQLATANQDNNILIEVGVLTYSSPQRPSGKRYVIHTIQQDTLGTALGSFYFVPVKVQLPENTKNNQIQIKLLTGDMYQGNIETDLTKTSFWYRSDSNGDKVQNGDYLSIDIPTKVYSVVVVDVEPSAIWNPGSDNCYSAPLIPTENIESYDLSLQGRSYGWYKLNVTDESAVYLDVPDTADYDLYVSDVCNGNHLWDLNENDLVKGCSYADGNGLNERCSISQPGTYYIELDLWGGKGEYKLYFGVDKDKDGTSDFMKFIR